LIEGSGEGHTIKQRDLSLSVSLPVAGTEKVLCLGQVDNGNGHDGAPRDWVTG